jgi:hypothetical protein
MALASIKYAASETPMIGSRYLGLNRTVWTLSHCTKKAPPRMATSVPKIDPMTKFRLCAMVKLNILLAGPGAALIQNHIFRRVSRNPIVRLYCPITILSCERPAKRKAIQNLPVLT